VLLGAARALKMQQTGNDTSNANGCPSSNSNICLTLGKRTAAK